MVIVDVICSIKRSLCFDISAYILTQDTSGTHNNFITIGVLFKYGQWTLSFELLSLHTPSTN